MWMYVWVCQWWCNEGQHEWLENFCAREECNLAGLAWFKFWWCSGLHRKTPTPTGSASGRADWIRLRAATHGESGAVPLPPPAANKDLCRRNEANKAWEACPAATRDSRRDLDGASELTLQRGLSIKVWAKAFIVWQRPVLVFCAHETKTNF